MTKKKTSADRGKEAEAEVQKWLEDRSASEAAFCYHRYPDARAARNALAAQPSDFLVAVKRSSKEPQITHLEVKETEQEVRLSRSRISQFGKLKMFDAAGIRAIVLINRTTLGDWVYLRGREMFHDEETPTSFPFAGRISYPTAAAALRSIFR